MLFKHQRVCILHSHIFLQDFFTFLESVTGMADVNLKTVWRISDTVIVEVHLHIMYTTTLLYLYRDNGVGILEIG